MNTKSQLKDKKCKNCGKVFTPRKPLQPVCSPTCELEYKKKKNGNFIKKRSKAILPVSDKRLKQLSEYRVLRKEFLSREENQICPVMYWLKGQVYKTTEIHHTNGRENERLNDVEYWLAVSREGHLWIHANLPKARELGWMI